MLAKQEQQFMHDSPIINIPTESFWDQLEHIEAGNGLTATHVKFVWDYLRGPKIEAEESFSLISGDRPEYISSVDVEGKNARYTMLAFALTIPKDMVP